MGALRATEKLEEDAAGLHADHSPEAWLRRDGETAAVNGFQNFVAATAEQRFTDCVAQFFGIVEVAVARFAENLRAIGVGNYGFKMQSAVPYFSKCADWDLAAPA